ncbi:hypothetical protein Hanom_Chr10g00935341 [Helianthus anomalus]
MMVNNPRCDSEGESVGKNGDNRNTEEDIEDGEIRSPEVVIQSPGREGGKSASDVLDHPEISIHEEPAVVEESDNNVFLHGKHGEVHGEVPLPRESNRISEDNINLAAGNVGGPNRTEERDCPFVDQVNQEGPTPLIGLGKRNRDNRSPPSSGSMEGPPVRGFCHDPPGSC